MKTTVVKDKEYGHILIVFNTPWSWRGYAPDNLSCWSKVDGHGACCAGFVAEQTLPIDDEQGKAILERYIQRYSPDEPTPYEYVSREQFLNHVFEEA